MRNVTSLLAGTALAALALLFTAGCAGPEQKLGSGVNNLTEVTRLGEMRRSVEQTTVFDSPEAGYTTGLIHGFDQTVARTAMGAYEIVTFPLPPYHPILTRYVPPGTVYPDSYHPGLPNTTTLQTDTYIGFSGGDIAPFIPGSRFTIFNN
jgi:putative exosortase-associated protein (TIGR04073 family)